MSADYDSDRWAELVELCPDLEETPEDRRAATLWQAFGIPKVSAPIPRYHGHLWRHTRDGWYECEACRIVSIGAFRLAMNGESWYEPPRGGSDWRSRPMVTAEASP